MRSQLQLHLVFLVALICLALALASPLHAVKRDGLAAKAGAAKRDLGDLENASNAKRMAAGLPPKAPKRHYKPSRAGAVKPRAS